MRSRLSISTTMEESLSFQEKDDDGLYIHRLRIHKSKLNLLYNQEDFDDKHGVSFHYTPYNFDSNPELNFFEKILVALDINVEDVEVFLFTGGLTDTKKTDFHFEYKSADGSYYRYFPDFVIVKNTGEFYIVEIKSERDRFNPIVEAKQKAVEYLKELQPTQHFDYNIIYTADQYIPEDDKMKAIRAWIRNEAATQTNPDEITLLEEQNEHQTQLKGVQCLVGWENVRSSESATTRPNFKKPIMQTIP